MGTRTYSRRGAGGVRVPTALGIRTGKFQAVREGAASYGFPEETAKRLGRAMQYFDQAEQAIKREPLATDLDAIPNNFASTYHPSDAGDARLSLNVSDERKEAYLEVFNGFSDVGRELTTQAFNDPALSERQRDTIGDAWDEMANAGSQLRSAGSGNDIYYGPYDEEYRGLNKGDVWRMSVMRGFLSNNVRLYNSEALKRMLTTIDYAEEKAKTWLNTPEMRPYGEALRDASRRARAVYNQFLSDENVYLREGPGNALAFMEDLPAGTMQRSNLEQIVPRSDAD